MATTQTMRDVRLRLRPYGHDQAEPPEPNGQIARLCGVLIFDDIPPQSEVLARMDRPDALNEASDGGLAAGSTQGYKFERANLPASFNVGGVNFSTRQKILLVTPSVPGRFVEDQRSPVWADFAPAQTGALVQSGKDSHTLVMAGPDTLNTDRELLRLRWTGTFVGAATLLAAVGGEQSLTGVFPTFHTKLAPGSVKVTLPGSGEVLYDDGEGGLVWDGLGGDPVSGIFNYVTSEWVITYNDGTTFSAGNILVDYEHDCDYAPIDGYLSWDPLLAE